MSGTLVGALDIAQFAGLLKQSRGPATHGYLRRNETAKAHTIFQASSKENALLSDGYALLSFRDVTLSSKAFAQDFAAQPLASIEHSITLFIRNAIQLINCHAQSRVVVQIHLLDHYRMHSQRQLLFTLNPQ